MPDWLLPFSTILGVLVGSSISYLSASRDRRLRREDLQKQLDTQRDLSEKQLFASVRSSNRQAWIDALRKDVANYLNLSQRMVLLRAAGESPTPGGVLFNMMVEAGQTYSAIELRLNPNEEMHVELLFRPRS